MSPELQSIVIPLLIACIVMASFHGSAMMAKKRVSVWKADTSVWFWRTVSLTGVERRAKTIWVDRFGYDYADALVLAQYQSLAYFLAVFGIVSLFLVAWYFLSKH